MLAQPHPIKNERVRKYFIHYAVFATGFILKGDFIKMLFFNFFNLGDKSLDF